MAMAHEEDPQWTGETRTWIVQVAGDTDGMWHDVARVGAKSGTHRREIIRLAFGQDTSQRKLSGPQEVRVLDEKSAKVSTVELVPRDPELRIQ